MDNASLCEFMLREVQGAVISLLLLAGKRAAALQIWIRVILAGRRLAALQMQGVHCSWSLYFCT